MNNTIIKKRVGKRQLYLNSLDHDLQFHSGEIRKGKFPYMHLGEKIGRDRAERECRYLGSEISRVMTDRSYKPWKSILNF